MGNRRQKPCEAKLAFSLFEDTSGGDGLTLTPREPPREFRIFEAGENTALKAPGTFLFDDVAAASVMEAFSRQGRGFLNFDYEHGATLGDGNPKPSAGRWVPEIRDGELWATQIQWTERAAALIASREYELFSPWFTHEQDAPYRVLTILNCALTNTPALENAMPLIAASAAGADMDPKEKEIEELKAALAAKDEELKALGVKLAALAAEDEEVKDELKDEEVAAALSLKTSLAAVTGKASAAAALGVVEQWKGQAAVAAKLTAEVEAQKTAKLSADFEEVFTKAKESGVAVASANDIRAKALKFGNGKVTEHALDFATAALGVAPKVPGGEVKAPSATLSLDSEATALYRRMGIDPAKVAEHKAKALSAR
jgi:phage I-like protein